MLRICIFILIACGAAFAQEEPLRLEFGVYPSDRATVMYRKLTPVLESLCEPLETQLDRKVDIHLTIFKDYESGIDALVNGEVDFVRFGPASYILASEQNDQIQLLAMELRKGLKRFNGLIIARKDSGIQTVEDLKGKSFAFGDRNSTIGRFLSQSLLVENNISSKELKKFAYLGRHDLVAQAVINGSFDAGALKSSTYIKLCDPEEVVVVQAFENVTKPWVAREGLPKKICDAITASLFTLEEKEDVLMELGCSGFAEASFDDYELVQDGMKTAIEFDSDEEPSED